MDDSSSWVPVETALLPPLPTPGFVFFYFYQNLTFYLGIKKKRFCFFDVFKHANDFFFRFRVLLESYFSVENLFFTKFLLIF